MTALRSSVTVIAVLAFTATIVMVTRADDPRPSERFSNHQILSLTPAKDVSDCGCSIPEIFVTTMESQPPRPPAIQKTPHGADSFRGSPPLSNRTEYFFAGGEIASSPKPIYLDGDPRAGIVFGTAQGRIYVLTADGDVAPGWPVATGTQVGYSTAAVADLNGDESHDIIFHANNSLEVYAQDGSALPGWPQALDGGITGNSIIGSPVVADIDNDEDFEILIGHLYRMFAFHHDGTTVTGWPVYQPHAFGPTFSTPAVGDIDNDGDLEICFKIYGGNGDPADIYLFHHDGTPVNGWPILDLDRSHLSSPVLADIDKDGVLDVVVSLHFFNSGNYVRLYVWKSDGTNVSGFPVVGSWNTTPVNNAVGDIDEDGFAEIFVATTHYTSPHYAIHAWNHDGTTLSGSWPRSASLCLPNGSPALTDVNGGRNEVIVGVGGCYTDDTGSMNVWEDDGDPVTTWPRPVSGWLRSSPLIMDSDGDSTPEIYIASTDGWIHRFLTEDASGGSDPQWNQIFHDPRNTNCYCPEDAAFTPYIGRLDGFGISIPSPNPSSFRTTIAYEIPSPGGDVKLSVYDVQGRWMVDLVRGFRPAGNHAVTWDRREVSGMHVRPGVYFVRLEAAGLRETMKATVSHPQ
jgi:hypothetical protein